MLYAAIQQQILHLLQRVICEQKNFPYSYFSNMANVTKVPNTQLHISNDENFLHRILHEILFYNNDERKKK